MNGILEFLSGKKTYLTAITIIVLLIGQAKGWWTLPAEMYAALSALGLAFLRAGVKSEVGDLLDGAEEPAPEVGAGANVGGQRSEVGGPGAAGKVILPAFVVMMLICGCASFNATTFRSEKAAADTARGAVHAWNQYIAVASNQVSQAECVKLMQAQAQIYEASRRLGATIQVVDGLRLAYATNSANTNLTALQAGLDAVVSQGTGIAELVRTFMGGQNGPVFTPVTAPVPK